MNKQINIFASSVLMFAVAGMAEAAVCTTNAGAGAWGAAATWSCGHVPLPADTVVISRAITLSANSTIAGLTVNAGVIFSGGNRNLNVVGNVVINGTLTSAGGVIQMTGAGTTVSGAGTIDNINFQIDALGVSLPAGSTLGFANQAQLRIGSINQASFALNGTITGAGLVAGDRIVRVYQNSSMTINGSVNASNAHIRVEQNASITNNGTVSVQYLRTDAVTSVWTQGNNSNLTLSATTPAGNWKGVLNASATGNTVTYNAPATPIAPSGNTYYNLAGTGVGCPHTFTVTGANPCAGGGGGGGGGGCATLLPTMPAGGSAVASGGTTTVGPGTNVNGVAVTGTGNSILNPGTTAAWSSAGTALSAPPSPIPTSTVVTTLGVGGLAAGSYGDVRVNAGVGVFTGGSYFINELYVAPGATAQLAPGDYYVNKLTVGSSITKTGGTLALSGSGLVRIFVTTNAKGDAALYGGSSGIWDGSLINVGGNPANLQMLLYPNVTYFEVGNNAQLTGFVVQPVYAGAAGNKAIDVHNGVIITGGVYTAGLLNIKNNVTFNYTPAVASALTSMSSCAGPHHFEISHASGTGVTCMPTTLTIKACADANVPCTAYTAGVTAGVLSATGTPSVNWTGGTGFVIPNGSSTVTKSVQVTTVGNTVFSATATPAPTTATTCNFGTPSCTFTASSSALIVSAPDHAAESAQTLTIKAVQTLGNPLACTAVTGNKTVNLKCAYSNPVSGTQAVRVAGVALNATNAPAAACDATGANVALTFDANGIATPSLQYADVGLMNITASYTGTAGTLDAGLSMTGAGTFTTAPASFSITNVTPGPIKAGNGFSATVTALNAAGNPTPNFGKESAPQGVTLSSALAGPVGGNNPVLGNSVIGGNLFTNGAATVSTFNWSEVGHINLNAALTNSTYLTSGLSATGTTGATVASATLFIPDHFDTQIITNAGVPMPCDSPALTCPANAAGAVGMVYSGQPFAVKVSAMNLAGAVTKNFNGATYAQDVTLSGVGGTGTLSNPLLTSASFVATGANAGTATTTTLPAYTFTSSITAPTDIAIHAVGSGVSAAIVSSGVGESGLKVVSGRIKISNAYGSEKLPLKINALTQYCAAVAAGSCTWVKSATDSATAITLAATYNVLDKNGATTGTTTPSPSGLATFASGVRDIVLSKPNAGAGSVQLSPTAPSYLPLLPGTATFGIYKGANEFIYLRESY